MGRVRRLSDDLINQIAAGEVVERPASVVKELAENSVDAGATQVKVLLSEGGLSAIAVIDDGHGMSKEDAVASLERHATSKLRDSDGLFQIRTKGFRGEAIPSIAAVSRFTMVTSEPESESATRIVIEGGGAPLIEEAPAPGGTRIDVIDLFFNVPARRKFLKRESTELTHCEEAITRLALAHPEVGFSLEHGGKLLISAPAAPDRPKERIASLLGSEVEPHLLAIDEKRLGVHISGFVASPEFTLPTARALYTFVNRRYIRDRGVNAAVQRAFQDSLPPGRQPVCTLFIDLDPEAVDVNVHPQKLEVRFSDQRGVIDAITAAISRALKAAPWRSSQGPVGDEVNAHYAQAVDRFLARAAETPGFALQPDAMPQPQANDLPGGAGFGTARPGINEAPPPGYFESLRFLGELSRRFWVCEATGGSLVVIDPRAVRERVVLDSLRARFEQGALKTSAPTLFSTTVNAPDAKQILAARELLLSVGVEIEDFGKDTLAIKRVPAELEGSDVASWLPLVAGSSDPFVALSVLAYAAASMQQQRAVSFDEAHGLLKELEGVDFDVPARRSTIVVTEIPLLDLEARSTE
ncbi:MAG: DNA mismatch repair endonuclease MutL [Archangium sp.]|nr:DNA mismatch repair endonuclease MutL [Archangium sp.]